MHTSKSILATLKSNCGLLLLLTVAPFTVTTSHAQSDVPLTDLTDSMTVAVLHVDTQRLKISAIPKSISEISAVPEMPPEVRERLRKFIELAHGESVYLTASIPHSANGSGERLITPEAIAAPFMNDWNWAGSEKIGNSWVAIFPTQDTEVSTKRYPQSATDRQAWVNCLASVAKLPVQLLVVPPEHFRLVIAELQPTLPESFGGGPSSVITEGLLWMALGFDPEAQELTIAIQSKSDESARLFVDTIPKLLPALSTALDALPRELALGIAELLRSRQPTISNAQSTYRIVINESDKK